jgi:hypothetical protein
VLYFAGGALALPLAAEEITVTIPPDPPAQTTQADATAPTESAPQQPDLPSFSAGHTMSPVAQDTTAPPPEVHQEAAPAPAAAPEPPQPVAQPQTQSQAPAPESAPAAAVTEPSSPSPAPEHEATKTKKAAAPAAETPSHAATAPASKPKARKARATASCKGLDEKACGDNKACIWVVGTPPEGASKGTSAGCRSMAALQKEAKKAAKAAKTSEPEVLPWAQHTTPAAPAGAGAAPAGATGDAPANAALPPAGADGAD